MFIRDAQPFQMKANVTAFAMMPVAMTQSSEASQPHPKLFIFGVGYVGLALAHSFQEQGWQVCGLTSSQQRAEAVKRKGIVAKAIQESDQKAVHAYVSHSLSTCTHVISTVAPQGQYDPVLKEYSSYLSQRSRWFGYLSSTSIYGDYKGAWVTEESVPRNPSRKASIRYAIEREWEDLVRDIGGSGTIFRLAGIYGPNRSALKTILRQPSVLKDSSDSMDMLVSRIHVDDIVSAVCGAVDKSYSIEEAGNTLVLNVADDAPASRREVFEYAESLLIERGLYKEVPVDGRGNDRTASVRTTRDLVRASKRVSNARMKELLNEKLCFPTYREGLLSIVDKLSKETDSL